MRRSASSRSVALPRRRVRDLDGDPPHTVGDRLGAAPRRCPPAPPTSARSHRPRAAPPRAPAAIAIGARPGSRDVSSRSTASSQERWRSPPATSSSTGSPSRSTWRATTCRKRTVDRRRPPSPSSRHSVRIVAAVVGMALGVRPRVDAAERPAALVLGRRAAVGPQQVALVEHRVGDRADRVHVAPPPAARRPCRPSSGARGAPCRRSSASKLLLVEPQPGACRGSSGPSSRARRAPAGGTRRRPPTRSAPACSCPPAPA